MDAVQQKAKDRVGKGLKVFDKALVEVRKAQTLLNEGIYEDTQQEKAIKKEIYRLEKEAKQVEKNKQAKALQHKENEELIKKLSNFKSK